MQTTLSNLLDLLFFGLSKTLLQNQCPDESQERDFNLHPIQSIPHFTTKSLSILHHCSIRYGWPCPALWIANAMTILFDLQLSATYCYETLICKLSEMMMDDFLQKSILICCQVNCNFFCFSCLLNLSSFTDSVHIKYQINKTLNP